MRALGYCRISQDRQGEGAGVARQREDVEELATRRGWSMAEVIVDNDSSAAGKSKRIGFERLLELVEARQVDVVVAWALDRLTRNRRDTVRLIETCQQASVTIALVRGSDMDMTTPAGRMVAEILASVARSEIEQKVDRHQRAALQRAQAGAWHGGRRAFGYEPDGITPREDEASRVRWAYEALLTGLSLGAVARRWNADGMLSPQTTRDGRSSQWSTASVSMALRKARYAGLRTHRGEVIGPAAWPALVDTETWHAAQGVLSSHARPATSSRTLLGGVALCGICETPVWAGQGKGRAIYRCRTTWGHVARERAPVDAYVSAAVVTRLSLPDAVRLLTPDGDSGEAAHAATRIEELRGRLDPLAAAHADGALTLSQLRTATERIRVQIDELEARLRGGRSRRAAWALTSAGNAEVAWSALEVEQRRQVVDSLAVVTIVPIGRGRGRTLPVHEKVSIEWRQG